ncbi:hypothetical protein ABEB36_006053 [Hypothenemus hampei]|uniref:Uncharacterized protein n=1 Tax=Hypothenemus hampei TaxID=57062 RepID=A0ABD1F301_HYPHA
MIGPTKHDRDGLRILRKTHCVKWQMDHMTNNGHSFGLLKAKFLKIWYWDCSKHVAIVYVLNSNIASTSKAKMCPSCGRTDHQRSSNKLAPNHEKKQFVDSSAKMSTYTIKCSFGTFFTNDDIKRRIVADIIEVSNLMVEASLKKKWQWERFVYEDLFTADKNKKVSTETTSFLKDFGFPANKKFVNMANEWWSPVPFLYRLAY